MAASAVEIAKQHKQLEAQLFSEALEAETFFRAKGYEVMTAGGKEVVGVTNGTLKVVCADGRFGNIPDVHASMLTLGRTDIVSVIGGIYFVMAHKTGGQPDGVRIAQEVGRQHGYEFSKHGDEHGDLGCAMFRQWTQNEITPDHNLAYGHEPVITEANKLQVPHYSLKGPHVETKFTVNYLPFTSVKPGVDRFREDIWVTDMLRIPAQSVIRTIDQILTNLNAGKAVQQQMRVIEIIR